MIHFPLKLYRNIAFYSPVYLYLGFLLSFSERENVHVQVEGEGQRARENLKQTPHREWSQMWGLISLP